MQFEGLSSYIIILLNFLSLSSSDGVSRDNTDDTRNISARASGPKSAKEMSILQSESLLYSQLIAGGSNLTICISESGTNTPDCIYKSEASPCRTIQHAYNEAMMQITNATKYIKFFFMDERYEMTESLILNREARFVKNIEFTSTLLTNITGMSEEAVLWIGCNTTSTFPCISYDVEFSNLNFSNFGSKLPAVVVAFDINYLSLHDCSFCNNNRSAINLLDTSVVLNNVEFSDNNGNAKFMDIEDELPAGFPSSNISNGGAVAFAFRNGHHKFANISSCSFFNNSAAENLELPFIGHSQTDTQFPRVGGGALVFFMGNCTDVHVIFATSNFFGNTAYAGGAGAIISEFNSSTNKVTFIACNFLNNTAKLSSGAIVFATFLRAESNRMSIIDCTIAYNRAKYAGAVKYIINGIKRRNVMRPAVRGLEIIRSKICSNIAETGSAVHIIASDFSTRQQLDPARIVDSLFCEHNFLGYCETNNIISHYRGAIGTNNMDIIFIGNNEIKDNNAVCGLFASNGNIHVNGTLKITRNFGAAFGGGMVLADTSQLILYPGSHLRFEGNRASQFGGALAVFSIGMPNITYVYNPFCFLQYSIPYQPYSKWDTKVEFIGNSAGFRGGAMFINTMTACLWMDDPPHYSFEKAFRWNDKFVYKENCVGSRDQDVNASCNADIATDTFELVLHSPKQATIAPGEKVSFELSGFDELKREPRIAAVAYLRAMLKKSGREVRSQLTLPNAYFVLDPPQEKGSLKIMYEVNGSNYRGITNDSVQYEITFFDSSSSFIAKAKMNITPIYCRPGYVYDGKRACKCDATHTFIKSCSGTNITLNGYLWATSSNGRLATARCPPNYCKCTKYSNPGECIYDSLHTDSQCSENRVGVLCGACKGPNDNITYGLSLDDGECIECDSKSITKATVLLVVLTIAVLCVALLIVYFNPTISTKMRGPIFYVQMLPYYYTGKSTWGTIIRSTASVLALGGSSHLPISGCLGNDLNRLEVISLTYIFAAVILVVLVTIYILSHYLLIHFKRNSPFDSLWLLLIAVYCLFCETSLIFFYCVDVNDKSVLFYDGTVECFHGKHLVMVIISSIVLVFFVIVPPVAVFLISTGRSNAPLAVVDALCKGLRLRFRWWWAVDLTRRIAYAASFAFARQDMMIFGILCITSLSLHTACQPYKDTFSNMSEAFLLFSMSVIAVLRAAPTGYTIDEVVTAIIAANLIYIIILFLYLVVRFFERRFNRDIGSCFRRVEERRRIPIPYRIIETEREENSSD